MFFRRTVISIILLIAAFIPAIGFAVEEITLTKAGVAKMPIIVSQIASNSVLSSANKLADYLGKITNGQFQIMTGNGAEGIAVGVYTDFPELALETQFNPNKLPDAEAYLLYIHSSGVHIIGATELAV
jgi:hypothetical protein